MTPKHTRGITIIILKKSIELKESVIFALIGSKLIGGNKDKQKVTQYRGENQRVCCDASSI